MADPAQPGEPVAAGEPGTPGEPGSTGAPGEMVCVTCGRTPDPSDPAQAPGAAELTWSRGIERGVPVWTCPQCSRDNLRSIEGKLDSAWW